MENIKLMTKIIVFFLFSLNYLFCDWYKKQDNIDVLHYKFNITLNDTTNNIQGETEIKINYLSETSNFDIDFISDELGLKVNQVILEGKSLKFNHRNDKIEISLTEPIKKNETKIFVIKYEGIPQDGLIISENIYKKRTIFADNWPDRARYWIPVIDHPSDKATCEFLVYAPEKYKIIANGLLKEETIYKENIKKTNWIQNEPIPTKVMVFGAAEFILSDKINYKHITNQNWIYKDNAPENLNDFNQTIEIIKFYEQLFGEFPYQKLDNVQSTTKYGGMENASCIFYNERTVTGKGMIDALIAHETVHQWFGNSISEYNWEDIWLSEGFATYFTLVYREKYQGKVKFINGLKSDRNRIIQFANKNPELSIVDTNLTDSKYLLSTNSYQKGSWILHMLRSDFGDSLFYKTISDYYKKHKNSTATTKDYFKIVKILTGKDYDKFMYDWLYSPGLPYLDFQINYNTKSKKTSLMIIQNQTNDVIYNFNLDIEFVLANGEKQIKQFKIDSTKNEYDFELNDKPIQIEPDPNTKILFDYSKEKVIINYNEIDVKYKFPSEGKELKINFQGEREE